MKGLVHLKVAYELFARYGNGRIEQPGDFLLGSVAPDAVHFHNEYDVSLKERSHLWKFGPRWGITLDSEGWRDAIYKFWEEIWQLLEQGRVYGIEGCVLEEDLARQKRSLLIEQFTGEKVYDVSGYQFCTKEIMGEFVKKCVQEILNLRK